MAQVWERDLDLTLETLGKPGIPLEGVRVGKLVPRGLCSEDLASHLHPEHQQRAQEVGSALGGEDALGSAAAAALTRAKGLLPLATSPAKLLGPAGSPAPGAAGTLRSPSCRQVNHCLRAAPGPCFSLRNLQHPALTVGNFLFSS